jgi:hypothetical protein
LAERDQLIESVQECRVDHVYGGCDPVDGSFDVDQVALDILETVVRGYELIKEIICGRHGGTPPLG